MHHLSADTNDEIFYGSYTPQVIWAWSPQNVTDTPSRICQHLMVSTGEHGSLDILAYDLYRGTSFTSMTAGDRWGTSFMDMGTARGTTYYYQVSAFNRKGRGRSPK